MKLSLTAICLALLASPAAAQTAPATPPAAQQHNCSIFYGTPSDGDKALAKKDYDAALAFFRAAVAKDPTSNEAQLGLVRAMVGKDQTAEAIKTADAAIAKSPQSAVAQIAAGEAAFRDANFNAARDHANAAIKADLCEGRAMDLIASLFSITANFASEARLLAMAHKLRPNDELILRDWIDSLPRKQRQVELNRYLASTNALSTKDLEGYNAEVDHLKARRPGECRITSKSDTAKVSFQPIYGGGGPMRPEAYGLDVAFNGKKRRMQIDTGASGILLSPAAAKRLGLEPEIHIHTGGIGDEGEVESYLSHVATIQIGDVQFSDCMVEVLKKSKLDVDGLIGLDVFEHWLATLDYPNTSLLLAPLPPRPGDTSAATGEPDDDETPHDAIVPPGMTDWTHFIRIGHDILLPAAINNSSTHFIIADTGSSSTTLSTAFAKAAGKLHEEPDIQMMGISGKVKTTYSVDNATLSFGSFRLPKESYLAIDMTNISHDESVEVSGLVGLPTLSRLTITVDYRDNLIQLKYDPKHDVQRF